MGAYMYDWEYDWPHSEVYVMTTDENSVWPRALSQRYANSPLP